MAQLFGSLDSFCTSAFAQTGDVMAADARSPHAIALLRIALPPF
jgi:hypothetical protein